MLITARLTRHLNVSTLNKNSIVLEVIFLRGLYFDKIKDKSDMWGFSLYHDSPGFRKRMFFHKDQAVIDMWLSKLKFHCNFYSVSEFYKQTVKLGGGKFSEVFEASSKRTAVTYALKRIDKTKLNQREKEFLRDEI